jgi:hypothetical protein
MNDVCLRSKLPNDATRGERQHGEKTSNPSYYYNDGDLFDCMKNEDLPPFVCCNITGRDMHALEAAVVLEEQKVFRSICHYNASKNDVLTVAMARSSR